jgi:hypothetical protein
MSLILSHTHDVQTEVLERGRGGGGLKCMRFMKNLNKQIGLTSYLNHS